MKARYDQATDFELNNIPLPDRKVLPRWKYLTPHVFEATRSCIHGCEFCVAPSAWGRKQLKKPVGHIVSDMRQMKTKKAIFIDLNLISDRAYALELFNALGPLNIQWYGLSTTLICNDIELLDAAAESGCRGLLMGLESINKSNLRGMGKGFNKPDDYKRVVGLLHERGIALQGCFVFGLDGDTVDIFEETASFAVDARIDLPRFAIATPFPGTRLYKRLESEGRIIDRDWSHYDGQHVVYRPTGMAATELQQGTVKAWEIAYSWKNIAKRLSSSAAPWYVAALTNWGYRHYAYRLDKYYTCDWFFDAGGVFQE
ncbi:MAG: radical SAM protein, partial [Gammaproteobacteria bacterium]